MATAKRAFEVADLGLTDAGQARIEWADEQMPVLRQVRERFERERPLDGLRVGACLHVTAETASLVRTLVAGGAEVALCASNPLSTQDEVAAALVDRHGAEVFAIQGEDARDLLPPHRGGLRQAPAGHARRRRRPDLRAARQPHRPAAGHPRRHREHHHRRDPRAGAARRRASWRSR